MEKNGTTCEKCGTTNTEDAAFCKSCGAKLAPQTITATQQPKPNPSKIGATTTSATPKPSKSRTPWIIGGIVVIALLVLAVIALAAGGGHISIGPSTPSSVTVTGNMVLSGQGTQPTALIFSSSQGTYPATLSQNGYTVTLPNPGTYSVQLQWTGSYSWQTGSIALSQYVLNQGAGASSSVTQDWNAYTPNSQITVAGSVQTVGLGTSPTGISFTSSQNGQASTTSVVGGSYSVYLPNDASYSVQVSWSGLLGVTGTCNAGTLSVQASAGTSTQSQNWSC